MNSIQLNINTGSDEVRDKLIAELSAFDIDGFEEQDDQLICYFRQGNVDEEHVNEKIRQAGLSSSRSVVYEQNWNASWESSFAPVVVDDFCTIRADFHKAGGNTQHEIIITPKMSFGTGHHATTYLMVQQMAQLDFVGKTVADFGTGTGVLSILAEKLGSTYAWAVDNDDWSIENAQENIARNNCTRIGLAKVDTFTPAQQFDIILANINKNTILGNLDGLVFGLNKGGTLLLSGLLQSDEEQVKISFANHNFTHLTTVQRDNWISMIFRFA
jgi:ribosomal protein L11 methyltransferase